MLLGARPPDTHSAQQTYLELERAVRVVDAAGAMTHSRATTRGQRGKWRRNEPPLKGAPSRSFRDVFKTLVTGAADDDPSGIGTYSQTGAQLGYGASWTMLLTFPLMAAIKEISARVGPRHRTRHRWQRLPPLSRKPAERHRLAAVYR